MIVICPIAGVGSYLQPFVVSKPKALIKVAGKPIIAHTLERIQQVVPKGTTIVFIVGYKKRLLIEYITHLNENMDNYFQLEFVEQESCGMHNDKPFFSGIGDAIALAKPFADNKDCFVFFSDRLPVNNYTTLLQQCESNNYDGIINVQEVDDPENYGVCVLDEHQIVQKIYEKPTSFISKLSIQGAFLIKKSISKRFMDYLVEQANTPLIPGETHSYVPIIQRLINEGAKIGIHQMKQKMLDFGSLDKFLEGNQELLEFHKSSLEKIKKLKQKGKIINSTIISPVFLGDDVFISSSVIGPNTSIGNKSKINRCILSNTVIGDNCDLSNFCTDSSIIGDFVTLENMIKNRLSIGDDSSIVSSKNI
ncbi:MAG: NDP-sugar synthase [Candidatus Lokiarchaeota archaeon]|nr:NDP-sugar synthase [Candidatus Harpocratesius repetitus]